MNAFKRIRRVAVDFGRRTQQTMSSLKVGNYLAMAGMLALFSALGTATAASPVLIPDEAYFAIYFNASNEAVHAETLTRCPTENASDGNCPTAEVLIDSDRELVLDWSTSSKCAHLMPSRQDIEPDEFEHLFKGNSWIPKDAVYAIYYDRGGQRLAIRGATTAILVVECVRKNNGQPVRGRLDPLDACRNDAAECAGQPCSPGYCAYWYNGVQYCKRC